jgi:hypothetical protein
MSTYVHSTELVASTRPLFDESRLAVAGFLARYSGPTRVSYAADLRPGSDGATRSAYWPSKPNVPISSCGPGCSKNEARPEQPSAAGCQHWRGSTASRSSTGSWTGPAPSTSGAPKSTPSRRRWGWIGRSSALSSPNARPPDPAITRRRA